MEFFTVEFGLLLSFLLGMPGIYYCYSNRKRIITILQAQIDSRTTGFFFHMILLGAIAMSTIFFLNKYLNLIVIFKTQNIFLSLKQLPSNFFGAFVEEFIFRIAIFIGFIKFFKGKYIALLGSSLAFCFLHNPENMITIISYFLAGLMYGISFITLKTIWAPIGLHFAWNYFQGSIFGFPVSGQSSNGYFLTETIADLNWNGGEVGPEGSILGIIVRIIIIIYILLLGRLRVNDHDEFLNIETS